MSDFIYSVPDLAGKPKRDLNMIHPPPQHRKYANTHFSLAKMFQCLTFYLHITKFDFNS
jgi:hypothetical protein